MFFVIEKKIYWKRFILFYGFTCWSNFNCVIWRITLPWWLSSKESICNARGAVDMGLIAGFGRSTGRETGNPLHYSSLENSMDRGAWKAVVHRVTNRWMWLSTNTMIYHIFLWCLAIWTDSSYLKRIVPLKVATVLLHLNFGSC